MADVKIHPEWKALLHEEFTKDYFQQIVTHIKTEMEAGTTIYPSGPNIFRAFELTPPSLLKVVIIGQDPYHGKGQADGLSFSVPATVKPPPSLKNIFKELSSDVGMATPKSGDLSAWAKQGVLLLNASLTVRENEAGSHSRIGWTIFTDAVIKRISDSKTGIVFLLWGNYAKEKAMFIDTKKHAVLSAAHPSPLSASNGFFGCRHFSKTNEILVSLKKEPINWYV